MITHIDEVAERTYRLQAEIPGVPAVFSIYLIKETSGVLIEPGPAALIPTIQAAINHLGLSDLEYIIPTHIHVDHGGGVGKLAQLFPQAKVVVHPQGARHVIDPSQLLQGTKMVFGGKFDTAYGAVLPVPESQVKIAQDEERLFVDSRELLIIHTPGHAPHHIAIFDTKVKGLFCGEALGISYSPESPPLPVVAPPSFDAEVYLNSMERLRQLKPNILFYSHDGVGNEPEKLISIAAENTRMLTDATLHAFKTEKTVEAVTRRIGEYIWSQFGIKLDELYLTMTVSGYNVYFKKKGLL